MKDSYSGVSNTSATYRIGSLSASISCSGTRIENNCTSAFNSTQLSDGSYTLLFSASDIAGNQKNESMQVQINNTKVFLTITYPANNAYVKGTININVTVGNVGPGIDKIQLRWENSSANSSWQDMTCSDYKCYYTWNTISFVETSYTFRFNVTGTLGYLVERTMTINVDNTKPLISIQKPTEKQVNGTIYPSMIITDGSGVNESKIRFNISTFSESMACASFESGKRLSCGGNFDTTKLSDGTYTLYFLASDLADNQNVESIQFAVYNIGVPPSQETTTTTTLATPTTTSPQPQVTPAGFVNNLISSVINTVKSNPIPVLAIAVIVIAILGYIYSKFKNPWKTSY